MPGEPRKPKATTISRLIVAGSRGYTDQPWVNEVLDFVLAKLTREGKIMTVISGHARGPDQFGEEWAKAKGVPLEIYPAQWTKYDKQAGLIRNEQMAQIADGLIAFWDGQSHGTRHMIDEATKRNLPTMVYIGRTLRGHEPKLPTEDDSRVKTGNMLDHLAECDMLLFTANSKLQNNGLLIMGAGAALAVKLRWPKLPAVLGSKIRQNYGDEGTYYILSAGVTKIPIADGMHPLEVCAFQTKIKPSDDADLNLITTAVSRLITWAKEAPDKRFYLNYPGIGLGHLSEGAVWPLLAKLPENVTIWKLPARDHTGM